MESPIERGDSSLGTALDDHWPSLDPHRSLMSVQLRPRVSVDRDTKLHQPPKAIAKASLKLSFAVIHLRQP